MPSKKIPTPRRIRLPLPYSSLPHLRDCDVHQNPSRQRTLFLQGFWRRAGEEKGTRIAWIQEGRKPSAKMALFYCKMACSLEDGLDQYHYHDKGLKPPKRMLRERNAAWSQNC